MHKFDYRKNVEIIASKYWGDYTKMNYFGTNYLNHKEVILNYDTPEEEILEKETSSFLSKETQQKLYQEHLSLNISMSQAIHYINGKRTLTDELRYFNLICTWYETKNSIHRLDGPARIDHAKNSRRWYCHGKPATKIYKIPGVKKPFRKGKKIGLVLSHVEGPFFEALIGNKKKLIVDAYDYEIKLKKDKYSRNHNKTNYDQNLID